MCTHAHARMRRPPDQRVRRSLVALLLRWLRIHAMQYVLLAKALLAAKAMAFAIIVGSGAAPSAH